MSKLKKGDKVPTFKLNNQDSKEVDMKNYLGEKKLVIFFYPKDDSPGCTKEACSFRDSHQDFVDLGCEVIGISSDNERSHKKFAEKHNLPYTLLADTNKEVRKMFGVPTNLLDIIPGRVTYVINQNGVIEYVFNSQTAVNKHMIEALNIVKEM